MGSNWSAHSGPNAAKTQGSMALLLSALAFSLMSVCVKHLGNRLPIAEILLSRALISLFITQFLLAKENISPWGKNKNLLFLRGLLGTGALFCVFYALGTLPLSAATVIQYTYPTFTAIAAWLILKENIKRRIIFAVLLGWMGIAIITRPEWITKSGEALPTIPTLIAISGAILTAFAYICVRQLSKYEHELVIIYYFPLISIPICLPFVLNDFIQPIGLEWFWISGIGLFTQLGQIGITKGLKILTAAKATTINYSQVLFSIFWGAIIFNESIDFWISIGAIFVLLGTLIGISSHK